MLQPLVIHTQLRGHRLHRLALAIQHQPAQVNSPFTLGSARGQTAQHPGRERLQPWAAPAPSPPVSRQCLGPALVDAADDSLLPARIVLVNHARPSSSYQRNRPLVGSAPSRWCSARTSSRALWTRPALEDGRDSFPFVSHHATPPGPSLGHHGAVREP